MENDYTYIGFICIDEHNKPVLVTKTGNKYNVSGVVGSTLEDNIKIDEYSALIWIIKYFVGTESVTLEYAHKANYEDIIFVIETEGVLSNDGDLTIFEMVYKDFDGLNFFWDFLEEYFETDEGMEQFEKFVKKDNWNNK